MIGSSEILQIIFSSLTIILSVIGAFMTIKISLAKHDDKIMRIEKDLDEMRNTRKNTDEDLKELYRVISRIDKTTAILDERTKK